METSCFKKQTRRRRHTKGPELEEILADIAMIFEKDVNEIKKKCMRSDLVLCRRIYCYVACIITNAPFPAIGRLINKDHTNVTYHREEAKNKIRDNNPDIIFDWFDYTNGSELWNEYKPNK